MTRRSVVYLIGAGPGDPGLITVRGLQCLASADVVVYDHLVHARLVGRARPGAETIDVGVAARQLLEQDAICYLLAEKAREGKSVARLIWGDPFLFDRGGSEALFLHEQGIAFEVVPGVPAGIAAPAYAGVPVTYPGGGDTLTFVRGQDGEGRMRPTVDWTSLAKLDGTIVCYVGTNELAEQVDALLTHGRSPQDSAAVVYEGTLPGQETRVGALEDLARTARETPNRRPAVLVLGRVVGLREHLRWFDTRPLFGRRVLVTRPRDQAAELVERLEALGAEAIEAPMIRIEPPLDLHPLEEACALAATFDWIIFPSANAVDAFIKGLLNTQQDLRALGGARLCVIGSATAERLSRYHLKVDLTPAEYRSEALLQAFAARGGIGGTKVLVPHADVGRELIADELRRRGADVTEVVAYRTVMAEPDREGEPDIYRMLLERRIDVVTFTSPSAVRGFVRLLGPEPAVDLLRATVVAAIGPVTAEAVTKCGIHATIVPSRYTVPAMVDAIAHHFEVPATA